MSFPYEKLIRSAPTRPVSRSSAETPSASGTRTPLDVGPSTPTLAQANAKKLASAKKMKPNLPFFVRPRFRFELPDPPMDPKMLLGRLSTVSYAEPFLSEMEHDFRPTAVPADPSYGLRANLTTGLPRRSAPHRLSIDDDALLQSVTSARGSSDKHTPDGTGLLRRTVTPGLPSSARPVQSSIVSAAPWMRRMGYDEYLTQKTVRPTSSSAKRGKTPVKSEAELLSDPKFKERRRNQILSTFGGARKKPVYPDMRKGHLTPVRVTPIFPDFASLLSNFIAVEFDHDETLTLESRAKNEDAAAKESIQTMATISVAEPVNVDRDREEPPKKFIACYTPTDHTLEQRKRKRSEDGDEAEGSDDNHSKRPTKFHLLEDEVYEWFGEYSIREGKYDGGVMSRSCFAANEAVSEDGDKKVVFLTRIGTTWKLARRPVLEHVLRLGKEGLEIKRNFTSNDIDDKVDYLRRNLLSGAKAKSGNGVKSEGVI